jgi:transglycosylase-like protein with SLT domain
MLALARDAAVRHSIEAALVCALIEQESSWDTNAMRYEGAFRARYVAPLGLPPTEEIARSISWGLMQVMGQVAREHGFEARFLSELCSAATGVDVGCAVLADKIAIATRMLNEAGVNVVANPLGSPPATCTGACRAATLGCVSLTGVSARGGASGNASSGDPGKFELWRRALNLWNGGANAEYAGQVIARLPNYQ